MGAFFFTKCADCTEEDCEDEGACKWQDGSSLPFGQGKCRDKKRENVPDESCKSFKDCYENGKRCDGIQDVGCICKNEQCKISCKFYKTEEKITYSLIIAGCGMMGAFFFTACKTCDKEDCEDEGACWWEDGKGCKEQKKTTLKPEIVENVGENIEWLNGNKTVSTQSARNGGQSVSTQTFALFLICGLMAV